MIIGLILIVSCSGGQNESSSVKPEGFVADVLLPTTPVQDQGRTEFCWIYAALAAIETDRLAQGDSVSLSPLWLERWMLQEVARESFFSGRKVSFRGTLPMAMRLIDKYGLVAADSYHPRYGNSDTPCTPYIQRQLTHLARVYSSQHRTYSEFKSAMESVLNDSLGYAPTMTILYGARYTPQELANSCLLPGDWKAYTSFTHHPYGETFAPELRDNQWHQEAMNLPMDTLLSRVEQSLCHRHPVMWEGCMKMKLPENRQQAFERGQLTDDHCMCIVGMGHDKNGTRYFILKNSWGTADGDHGFRYMSFEQFRRSTILVVMV